LHAKDFKQQCASLFISPKVFSIDVNLNVKHCCDRKAPATSAQSFTLRQQATIEITLHDHSPRMLLFTFSRSHRYYHQRLHAAITLLLLVRATYMGVVLRAHPVRGESHIQRNTNREFATAPTAAICLLLLKTTITGFSRFA